MTPKEQLLLELDQAPDLAIKLLLGVLRLFKRVFHYSVEQWEDRSLVTNIAQPSVDEEVDVPNFFKVVDEIHATVPWSEWERLPEDMAQNVDHYLYGAPKVEE